MKSDTASLIIDSIYSYELINWMNIKLSKKNALKTSDSLSISLHTSFLILISYLFPMILVAM